MNQVRHRVKDDFHGSAEMKLEKLTPGVSYRETKLRRGLASSQCSNSSQPRAGKCDEQGDLSGNS